MSAPHLERDSSDNILAAWTHGFAHPLSHSKFLILLSGIFCNKSIVLCLQCPVASSPCNLPALCWLQARAWANWSVIWQCQLSQPRLPCQQHTAVPAGIRTPYLNAILWTAGTCIPVSWPSSESARSELSHVCIWHPRSSSWKVVRLGTSFWQLLQWWWRVLFREPQLVCQILLLSNIIVWLHD